MRHILLRPTTEVDIEFVMEAERHPDNRAFVGQWSCEQHQQTLADPDFAHRIVAMPEERSVGFVILRGRQSADRCVELMRLVITDKGQGYGRATLEAAAKLAFDVWRAHRLWLDVVDNNARARHLYRSVGFVEEGTLRECLYYAEENCFRSSIVMAVLEQEYRR